MCFGRPENVPRLFDLVKPKDDKFLTAFYFALRDTLVAKDLDQATRIGLQVMPWLIQTRNLCSVQLDPCRLFYSTLQLESSKRDQKFNVFHNCRDVLATGL